MHDNDTPCCSAEQSAWIDLVKGFRSHIVRSVDKKARLSLNVLSGFAELTSHLMYLHILANSFDDKCEAMKAKQRKKAQSFE